MSFWCFEFVRCLIYKVQVPAPPGPLPGPLSTERSFIIPPKLLLVKPLFNFFKISFEPVLGFHPSAALANFAILPQCFPFVKSFFASRQIFFSQLPGFTALRLSAQLY